MKNKEKKIKILHVARAAGGIGVYIDLIVKHINDERFKNYIIHEDDYQSISFASKSGLPVKSYKLPIPREISPRKDWQAVLKTRKIIEEENIDLIHAHSAKGGVIARLAALGKGVKVLYTPNAFSYLSTPNTIKKFIFLNAERILKHFNSKLLASSPSEQERGIKEVGFKKENTYLFNNSIAPIETTRLTIPKKWPDSYICTVGRPSYQKRLDMMIKVLSELKKEIPNIHLIIMGVGFYAPELDSINELINKLNLSKNITLLPWTAKENVHHIIKNAQMYISTARYEGLPFSIIESLALGKPVVATNVDGNKDLIINGYNGFLIDGENIIEMKNKIMALLHNKERLEKFSFNAKRIFEEKYNIHQNIPLLEQIYLENIKK